MTLSTLWRIGVYKTRIVWSKTTNLDTCDRKKLFSIALAVQIVRYVIAQYLLVVSRRPIFITSYYFSFFKTQFGWHFMYYYDGLYLAGCIYYVELCGTRVWFKFIRVK